MAITKQQMWSLASLCVGRRSDFALQQADGRYLRAGRPLDYGALRLHLAGELTIGTYVADEQGRCHFAVFDADRDDGLFTLLEVQRVLAAAGIPSYLELSLRSWLLPFCPSGVEFYPKRDWVTDAHPGSLMRLPFGVHRLSGRRYPFVLLVGDRLVPVAPSVAEALTWLSTVERVTVPDEPRLAQSNQVGRETHTQYSAKKGVMTSTPIALMSIREWCAQQDACSIIGRYVELDANGLGCCPFGFHHSDGVDSRPSLWVHTPMAPDGACWYCHAWRRGGDLFDFLSLYHRLSKKELWHRILSGEQF